MILALCLAVLATSFISGILGMAGGMILMGILLALMPVSAAMVVHGTTQFASNGWRALLWREHIDWRVFRGYAIGALLALAAFSALQIVLSRAMVLIVLGLTPFSVYLLPRKLQLNVDRRGHSGACGLVCMAVQLLAGVSGPLLDTFFLSSALDRKAVVATKAAVQTLSHASRIAFFGVVLAGGADAPGWPVAALLMACAIAGTSISRRVLERMTDADFRSWTRRAVLTAGSVYLASGLWLAAGR
ncbi:MAG: sulfite exporter TauE/SafE family protein [Comamonadaceae bacterium]|nr:MAG: sulfite exporter TauE/SafE family protein [Comamonadaceae bacterium]